MNDFALHFISPLIVNNDRISPLIIKSDHIPPLIIKNDGISPCVLKKRHYPTPSLRVPGMTYQAYLTATVAMFFLAGGFEQILMISFIKNRVVVFICKKIRGFCRKTSFIDVYSVILENLFSTK